MKIGEILRALRNSKGCSQTDTAEYLTERGCAVTQRAVSNWERGTTLPNAEQLLLLCKFYGVRDVLSVFFGEPGLLGSLNDTGKKRVYEYIRLLENDDEFAAEKTKERQLRLIPLYDMPVSAGTGQFLDSSDYELIEVDESVPGTVNYAVRVRGDSMSPKFSDNDVIYISQQQTLERGEYGIFILNGNVYCKLLGGDESVQLISLNTAYDPITISDSDEFRVLGKVIL